VEEVVTTVSGATRAEPVLLFMRGACCSLSQVCFAAAKQQLQ